MVKVICQYTGIEFEAKSLRSKNHPRVAALLETANRKGVYSLVIEAMVQARRDGVEGDAIIEAGQIALSRGSQAAAEFNARWRSERRQRLQEESRRIENYHGQRRLEEEEAEARDIAEFKPGVIGAEEERFG